ncbi:MAG TPA: hypothetical protein VGD80_36040 [Kofleriaceae bacterium]
MTRLALLGALLIPALASAQPAPDDPGAPAPTVIVTPPAPAPAPMVAVPPEPEYREVYDSYNAPMFAAGAAVFGLTYGASVITAATSDNARGNNRLYVPLVGPWLALHDRGPCDILKSSCDHETTAKVLLIADGVFQAAGVIGMLDGLLRPSTHRVLVTQAKVDTRTHIRPTVIGSVSGAAPGVAVRGHF